jgi:RimJ/RimL family protein N-acetyltransferase
MPIIKSKNFILRPFRRGDEASLIKHINDKFIAKNTLHIPYPYTLKDAKKWINHNLELSKKRNKQEINFAIEVNGEVVGGIGLGYIDNCSAEIGYWLGRRYWGQGIMTEAVKLVTKYAFEKLGLKRVYAYVFWGNKQSVRVLEKNGFKLEGKLKKYAKKGNKFLDALLFAKVI